LSRGFGRDATILNQLLITAGGPATVPARASLAAVARTKTAEPLKSAVKR